ncbi:MAG TPA: UDP-glucose 4-epimerase GalE [Chloroflexi bacterium]|nr:UDP-glucose 4-epimerase GalE [Chloroflexota bacterium]
MRVLVVGGAGYIGSVTAAHLLKAGHEVIVYDSLVRGYREAVPEEATFVEGDLGDRKALDAAFEAHRPDAVMHFAAFIEAGESMQKPGVYFRNNVCNSLELLEAMVAHDVGRMIFSSTAAVYASKDTPLEEDDPLGPSNAYGETKLMIERMLHWYHEVYGLRYCALRYFNACGAMVDEEGRAIRGEAHRPESHLIPLLLQVPLGQREALYLFGTDYPTPDGTCIRDYIHVEDLAAAHVLALEALDSREVMIYNVGNGRGYSNREVIAVAREVTGHPIPIVETDRRPGDAPILVASAEKLRAELGWEPRYPDLKQIIATAWEWHRTHPYGYQTINGT